MVQFTISTTVGSPAAALWEYLGDFRRQPEFSPHTKAAYLTTPEPIGEGSRFRQVASFLGRSIENAIEIVEYEAGRKVAYEVRDGAFPLRWSYELEPVKGGTKIRIETVASPGGFFKLAGPLLKRKVKGDATDDLRRLEKIVEGAATAS